MGSADRSSCRGVALNLQPLPTLLKAEVKVIIQVPCNANVAAGSVHTLIWLMVNWAAEEMKTNREHVIWPVDRSPK